MKPGQISKGNIMKSVFSGKYIFIIDDESEILMAVETTLKMEGIDNIITIQDSRQVFEKFKTHPPCMLILDLNMPHINGEKILEYMSKNLPDIPVIIMTGSIDVDTAVRCMKTGALDYVVKPVEEDRLMAAIRNAGAYFEANHPVTPSDADDMDAALKSEMFEQIITRHEGMHNVFAYIRSIAPSGQPVLILGETGVGKELIATSLHALSNLEGPLITVNVAGLDDTIFSDTLFGHKKGAFTGADSHRNGMIEQAENGTLFLDEIGDLGLNAQVKLLRLLQEKEYLPLGSDKTQISSARIIASTNRDLWALEKQGDFRKDLIYRLSTHTVNVPPLRERACDLPLLISQFVHHAAEELFKPLPRISDQLIRELESYPFEGNIRELRSMVFDAMSRYTSGELTPDLFSNLNKALKPTGLKTTNGKPKLPTLKEASDHLVLKAMEEAGNNQSAAAKILGISQQALSKRLIKLKKEKD